MQDCVNIPLVQRDETRVGPGVNGNRINAHLFTVTYG